MRFNRLKAELRGFEFDIIYQKGSLNPVDALLRNPLLAEGEEDPEKSRVELYEIAKENDPRDNMAEVYHNYMTRNSKRNLANRNTTDQSSTEAHGKINRKKRTRI